MLDGNTDAMVVPELSERSLLLLSGGHDSIALAAWLRPAACLTIDYGQRPVEGEIRAAAAVSGALGLPWHSFRVDLTPVGSGLLHGDDKASETALVNSPSPEWWPYRNQLLVSLAAAWALPRGFDQIVVGSVKPDGDRHLDGTAGFYTRIDDVVAYQEGGIRVFAPATDMTTVDLVNTSGVTDDVLGYAHSCHIATYSCGACPGCRKHEEVLATSGRLQ